MTRDIFVDPLPVSFGDTAANHSPLCHLVTLPQTPPPLDSHVLFEWPLNGLRTGVYLIARWFYHLLSNL